MHVSEDAYIISVLLGDGGSGGALALCIADTVVALEHATLSVIAPKACANILWKDSSKELEAAAILKMQASDLVEIGIVDKTIQEPEGGAHTDPVIMSDVIQRHLSKEIRYYMNVAVTKKLKKRHRKYNNIRHQYYNPKSI